MRVPPPPSKPVGLRGWIRDVLRLAGRRPKDYLGQVFIVDQRGVEIFIEAVKSLPEGPLLEMGVGPGNLAYYIGRERLVVGVEIDPDLAWIAASIVKGLPVTIIYGDGPSILESIRVTGAYSNAPYKETGRIISSSARNNSLKMLILGLQLEVARRILAEPGSRDYGRITLLSKRYFRVEEISRIPRKWYYPVPEVHGSLLRFTRMREWRGGDECFEKLTACLFTGRNRLADKMAAKCMGASRSILLRLRGKRVRELSVDDVEWLMEFGGCMRHQ